MSILIKDMEMPKSCADCRFYGEYCHAKGDENKHSKLPCPLVPASPAVVRCEYCKHSLKDDLFRTRWCQKPGHVKEVKDEFFCADGERKDDETPDGRL